MNTRKTKFILLIIILTVVLAIGGTIVINNTGIVDVIRYRLTTEIMGLESTLTADELSWDNVSISPGCSDWITDSSTTIKLYVPYSWNASDNIELYYQWAEEDVSYDAWIQLDNYYYSLQNSTGYYEISVPEEERLLEFTYSKACLRRCGKYYLQCSRCGTIQV